MSNKFKDEMAQFLMEATGFVQGLKREAETYVKFKVETLTNDLHFVKQEDYEVLKDMVRALKAEHELFSERLGHLQRKIEEHECLNTIITDGQKPSNKKHKSS